VRVKNEVTLSKGGTAERTVEVVKIEIPSLWHIAQRLPSGDRAEVLACWHLAHDLKRELLERGAK
jgi:hypothetical protein